MADSTPNTILLKGADTAVQFEGTAGGAVKPGHLVMLNSSNQIVVHNADVIGAPPIGVALEDDAQGRGIDDAYDATTYKTVRYVALSPGMEVYGWVIGAVATSPGSSLGSNGDGTFDLAVVTSPAVAQPVYGVSLETKSATASPGVPQRCKIRIV